MNKFSNELTNTRAFLLDAEATLHFLDNRENLNNLLNAECADVVLGALIEKLHTLVGDACGRCELLEKASDEDLIAECRALALETQAVNTAPNNNINH